MSFVWYPFNPADFRRDTYHLCAAADGIYRRLIDEYMQVQLPLPDNDGALASIARVTLAEWNEHQEVVRAFFMPKSGKLYHKRCELELDAQRMRHALRSKIGKEAATIRWAQAKRYQKDKYITHALTMPNAMPMDATLHKKDIEEGHSGKKEDGIAPTPHLVDVMRQKKWVR